jgi:hypothetical protein
VDCHGLDLHRLAEERSLAYHRVVAARLTQEPRVLEEARERVASWLASGRSPYYAREWQRILTCTADEVARVLLGEDDHARALRQATPFAGVLKPKERWQIWKEVRERMTATAPR